MRIAGSTLQFSAHYERVERLEINESLRVWNTATAADTSPSKSAEPSHPHQEEAPTAQTLLDAKLLLLRLFVERLTGRKLKLIDVAALAKARDAESAPLPAPQENGNPSSNWGAVYNREEFHYELEQTQFTAAGLIRTAQGQEIQIHLELTMSREFMEKTGVQWRAGAALKDPLVINFNGAAAQLTDQSISFDLMANGSQGLLPILGSNSAYLAWDQNGDGKINDGHELFGPTSGQGFGELAALDSDGNGWIDEADPLFAHLRLWSPNTSKESSLATLKERGVGAISLNALASPFTLQKEGETLGQIRSTGIYLAENGSAGSVQQLDVKA